MRVVRVGRKSRREKRRESRQERDSIRSEFSLWEPIGVGGEARPSRARLPFLRIHILKREGSPEELFQGVVQGLGKSGWRG